MYSKNRSLRITNRSRPKTIKSRCYLTISILPFLFRMDSLVHFSYLGQFQLHILWIQAVRKGSIHFIEKEFL